MNKLFKFFVTLTFSLWASLLMAKTSQAVTACESQYGGGETCREINLVMINKKIFDPDGSKFTDNLGINNFKFAPEDEIRFIVSVKNTSDKTLTNLKVKDTLPAKLIFINGPASWNDKEMSFTIEKLEVGESKEFEIRAKVVSANNIPANEIICQLNHVDVWAGSQNNPDDADNSQVCIENKVLAKVTPVTGPSALPLALFGILIAAGLFLRKAHL